MTPVILLALASLSCAQVTKKKEAEPLMTTVPQPLWTYDTGG